MSIVCLACRGSICLLHGSSCLWVLVHDMTYGFWMIDRTIFISNMNVCLMAFMSGHLCLWVPVSNLWDTQIFCTAACILASFLLNCKVTERGEWCSEQTFPRSSLSNSLPAHFSQPYYPLFLNFANIRKSTWIQILGSCSSFCCIGWSVGVQAALNACTWCWLWLGSPSPQIDEGCA